MDYPKSTPGVGLVGGRFVDENAASGQPGSLIPAAWGNLITEEILNVIRNAGLEPSEEDATQLLKAIALAITWDAIRGKPTTLKGYGITDALQIGIVSQQRPVLAAPTEGDTYDDAALVIREAKGAGNTQDTPRFAPSISFFWGDRIAGKLLMDAQGRLVWRGATLLSGDDLAGIGQALAGKADKATTLKGYGITDALQIGVVSQQRPVLAAPTPGDTFDDAALVIREAKGAGNTQSAPGCAPSISFLWGDRVAGKLLMDALGRLVWRGESLLSSSDMDAIIAELGKKAYSVDTLAKTAKATVTDIITSASVSRYVDPAGVFASVQHQLAGSVVFVAMSEPPPGFLKANGALVSRVTYSKLFDRIGTFYGVGDGVTTFALPDLRGEFLRCWDDGRGIDYNRPFGSGQLGAIEAHSHAMTGSVNFTYQLNTDSNMKPYQGAGSSYQTGVTGGSETRPRNMALLACIKY
ncbi:MAG: tail fiber protein [Paucimonas sp.]|jgi:microcystin-dependent protein|nr:tail fiber protein [Paucimonas sp.]